MNRSARATQSHVRVSSSPVFQVVILALTAAVSLMVAAWALKHGVLAAVLALVTTGPVAFFVVGYGVLFLALGLRRVIPADSSLAYEIESFLFAGRTKPRDGGAARRVEDDRAGGRARFCVFCVV